MNTIHRNIPRIAALTTAVAAALALAACDRSSNETVGQKVDDAVAASKNAATEAGKDIKAAASDVKEATKEAAGDLASGAKDATITAKVNAALAADDKLSAMAIDVDTEKGRVELTGTAPDAESKARATTLAASVEGVTAVNNQLDIKPKS